MNSHFQQISCNQIEENPFTLIGKKWMLISAGNSPDNFNMMTASWGGFGWLWERPVAFIFIRPQRYTNHFVLHQSYFTLSFFAEQYRKILSKLGTVSGRNFDKINKSGLHPFLFNDTSVSYEESNMILLCKKQLTMQMNEQHFHENTIPLEFYPEKDFHTVFIGEILIAAVKK